MYCELGSYSINTNDKFQKFDLSSWYAGKDYFIWAGPTPMINIFKPEMIREALTKFRDIQKPKLNHIVDKLFPGLINYEGEEWINHRKLLNPAFHMEKLKVFSLNVTLILSFHPPMLNNKPYEISY